MRKRTSHILKYNAKNEMPSRIIFFDTETTEHKIGPDESELKFKLGSLCYFRWNEGKSVKDTELWYDYYSDTQFWDFVEAHVYSKERLYLVAHNIAFDMRVLAGFEQLKNRGWTITKMIFASTMNIWTFRKDNRTLLFLDNMNYFKSSLKILGHSIGHEKMEMPTDDDALLMVYCRNDVRIMLESWKIYLKFLNENDLGKFAKTIAAQSLNAYRHRFMDFPIHIHTWQRAIDMERESYHGGRTEAFYIGKLSDNQDYYLLDVNSMYPSVMKEYKYPNKILGNIDNVTPYQLQDVLKLHAVIAHVLIETKEPVFPVKHKGKLIFPIGTFEAHLSTRELEYALSHDMVRDIRDAVFYEQKNLFKKYVNFFYNKRQEYKDANNEAFSYLCKLFLNSLYGKFGQRNESYEKVDYNADFEDGAVEYYDEDNKLVRERVINGVVERSTGMKEGYDSFVAIASHVTADARMKLWSYFNLAGRENVYYCDTDSLLVNQEGYERSRHLIRKDLGLLSCKDSSKNVIIRGAKDYIFGEDVVMKGIRKDAEQIEENTFRQVRFEGLAGAIRNNRVNDMRISTITKTMKRDYNKGKVNIGGKVTPHILNYSRQGTIFS